MIVTRPTDADVGDTAGERDSFAKGRHRLQRKYVGGFFTSPITVTRRQRRDFDRGGSSYARVRPPHGVSNGARREICNVHWAEPRAASRRRSRQFEPCQRTLCRAKF